MPSPETPSPLFPRQFPPPVLADVPMEYIVHKLHQLAPRYWDKPDTADCTISMRMQTDFLRVFADTNYVSYTHPTSYWASKTCTRHAALRRLGHAYA